MLVREVQRILASKDSDEAINPSETFARIYEIAQGKDVYLNHGGRGPESGQTPEAKPKSECPNSECLFWILAHWQINPIVFFVGLINAFAILGAIFAVFD